jgi:Kef-type K+ transport system membrane component KefB
MKYSFDKSLLNRFIIRLNMTKIAGKYPESIFIFVIMIAFLYVMATEFVGLSAIVGSFLAGASFAGVKLIRGKVFKEGAGYF